VAKDGNQRVQPPSIASVFLGLTVGGLYFVNRSIYQAGVREADAGYDP
jgi:hypothetical protein